ncbi:MAG: molybdopterin-binding protein [Candidatus Methanomethylicia archaeon]
MEGEKVVEIISIGEELLIGKVVNTNASWIARRIAELGGKVRRIITVGDNTEEIISAIRDSVSRGTNIIITTGGLGPTFDDKTMEAISKLTEKPLKLDMEVLKGIEEKVRKRGRKISDSARKMAYVPEGSKILHNSIGTAPGIMIEYENAIIIALPGVPSEMEAMFNDQVIKIVKTEHKLLEREFIIYGVPEAVLAPTVIEIMKEIPNIYIKTHPKMELGERPVLRLHMYSREYEWEAWEEIVERVKGKIMEIHKCEVQEA